MKVFINKATCLIVILGSFILKTYGQNTSQVDNLLKSNKKTTVDTTKVNTLILLSEEYFTINKDSALLMAKQALQKELSTMQVKKENELLEKEITLAQKESDIQKTITKVLSILFVTAILFVLIILYLLRKNRKSQILIEKQKKEMDIIMNSLPVGLCKIDTNYNVIWANNAIERTYETANKKDQNFKDLLDPLIFSIVEEKLKNIGKDDKLVIEGAMNSDRSIAEKYEEGKRWVKVVYIPIKNEANEIEEFIVLDDDHTEEKLKEYRLESQKKEIEDINNKLLETNSALKEATIEARSQKEQVERAHKEITDSIYYAKRIQSAILPPIEIVKNHLKDSFILYKPKNIVAGDFYWLSHKNNKTLFAACDCTGHGVPAAMVSVICNNGLNRSVREYGLTDPGKILDKTRKIVIEEFEKSEEEVKDGMDIALCSLEGNTLSYAGANTPLWIIRNGEIIEIKGDKQPIGAFWRKTNFTTHIIELEKSDTIYIFSDGYQDQFGGERGKKFMRTNFKKLLLSIQDKPMDKQFELINQVFVNWKGNLEQLDDVCVIGVKV